MNYTDSTDKQDKPFVKEITVKTMFDEDPDLSWLKQDHKPSDFNHCSDEDIQKVIAQYGSLEAACEAYKEQDKHRLETYGQLWEMIGVKAVATVYLPIGNGSYKIQEIDSGGLWGIESDSDKEYIDGVKKEQIAELKNYLKMLCVTCADDVEIKDSD